MKWGGHELIKRNESKAISAVVAAGSVMGCTWSVLLTRRCLDTRGLFYNLGFNRCAFYVAGSPEFRCRCPRRWGRKAGHKTCLWNFGRINVDMTVKRAEIWTAYLFDTHTHTHTCYCSVSHQMKVRDGRTRGQVKSCACCMFNPI